VNAEPIAASLLCPFFLWTGWPAVEAMAALVTAATAIVAVVYAAIQLDSVRKENRISHLIELVNDFERPPIADARRKLAKARLRDGKLLELNVEEPPPGLHSLMNFFEHMGFLLRDGYIDVDGVATEFHYWIFRIWADAKLVIRYEQEEASIYYECFSKMVERLAAYEREKHRVLEVIDDEELEYFYNEEAELPDNSPIPKESAGRKGRKKKGATGAKS
jgi:hypothetical protein